jgi:hypothetical protein
MLYVATVILNRTENEFWDMTPRKFFALVDCHIEINKVENKETKENDSIDEQMKKAKKLTIGEALAWAHKA